MFIRKITLALGVTLLSVSAAHADHHMAKAIKKADVAGSHAFTNAMGMTLYTFDKDSTGKSNCNGDCAQKWPPLFAESSSMAEGDFSVIQRSDGSHQWAYKGMALYTWFKDKKPGDNTGDGVKGVWHTARP